MNKAILMGRLTADPELRYTQNNTAVCRFTLAVDRYMGQDKENQADFISCTAWGKTAEFISQYYFKGKKALVEGNIKTGSYDDKNGRKVYTTEVWVERIDFADDKRKDNNGGQASQRQTISNDNPPWDSSEDDFPRTNQQPVSQQSVNDSAPPWMR